MVGIRSTRPLTVAVGALLTVVVAACGGEAVATTGAGPACVVLDSSDQGGVPASIQGGEFRPPSIDIPTGRVVTWTNDDVLVHEIELSDGSCRSGTIGTGEQVSLAFHVAGTYGFACTIHPTMTGTVRVS